MRLTTLIVAAVIVGGAGGAGVLAAARGGLVSGWRADNVVTVDGLPGEWARLDPLDRGPSVGAMNDGEYLYLVVRATDPDSIPLVSTGLIVWLDPAGRRAQTFGVWIPGVEQAPLPGMTPTPSSSSTAIGTTMLDRFDVLGPGQNQRRLVDLTPELGIELASSYGEGEVTYEMRIPLQKSSSRVYAVGVAPGRTIGLGIATPEAPATRGQPPRLVGDTGFIGGSPWTGGGFARYREDDGRRKPLQIWTTLTIASPR